MYCLVLIVMQWLIKNASEDAPILYKIWVRL